MRKITPYKIIIIICVVAMFFLVGSIGTSFTEYKNETVRKVGQLETAHTRKLQEITRSVTQALLGNASFTGDTIYVYDLVEDRIIFDKNSDTPRNLASFAKIVLSRMLLETPVKDTTVCMTQEALAAINDQGLRVGQCYDGTTAINAMLVSSSNDLSALLDAEAKEYGFSLDQYISSRQWDMVIYDSSGFDFGDEQKISQGYAHDILMVAYEILVDYPSIADATTREAYPIADSAVQHTYARVADTSALRFAKTGYTALAGGNMMAIIEPAPGILIGIVVMRSGFLERFVDFEEIVSIIEYSYNLTH